MDLGDGSYRFMGDMSMANMWDFEWDVVADADPFVNGGLVVTNTTGATSTFNLTVTLAVAPAITPSSLMGGSIGFTYSDSNNDGLGGATSVGGAGPVYTGMIDGVLQSPAADLLNNMSLTPSFAGDSVATSANFGLPGPTIPGPAVNTSIGIQHTFDLSNADSASLTSNFVVVPEPATMALLVLSGLAILRRRSA
jgi:hypothetical protein